MSRSLNRIRHLISEIEEIQRQGQQVGRNALDRTANLKPIPETPKALVMTQAVPEAVTQPVVVPPPPPVSTPEIEEEDPFAALDTVVGFPPPPPLKEVAPEPVKPVSIPTAPTPVATGGRVSMQLSSQIVLSLQMENSDECVELKQNGDSIEIRFSDGKAVHLPLKSVA